MIHLLVVKPDLLHKVLPTNNINVCVHTRTLLSTCIYTVTDLDIWHYNIYVLLLHENALWTSHRYFVIVFSSSFDFFWRRTKLGFLASRTRQYLKKKYTYGNTKVILFGNTKVILFAFLNKCACATKFGKRKQYISIL